MIVADYNTKNTNLQHHPLVVFRISWVLRERWVLTRGRLFTKSDQHGGIEEHTIIQSRTRESQATSYVEVLWVSNLQQSCQHSLQNFYGKTATIRPPWVPENCLWKAAWSIAPNGARCIAYLDCSWGLSEASFQHIHVDIVCPLSPSNGYTHLLTCVGCFIRHRSKTLRPHQSFKSSSTGGYQSTMFQQQSQPAVELNSHKLSFAI